MGSARENVSLNLIEIPLFTYYIILLDVLMNATELLISINCHLMTLSIKDQIQRRIKIETMNVCWHCSWFDSSHSNFVS